MKSYKLRYELSVDYQKVIVESEVTTKKDLTAESLLEIAKTELANAIEASVFVNGSRVGAPPMRPPKQNQVQQVQPPQQQPPQQQIQSPQVQQSQQSTWTGYGADHELAFTNQGTQSTSKDKIPLTWGEIKKIRAHGMKFWLMNKIDIDKLPPS